MTKTEQAVIEGVARRLRGERASAEVKEALQSDALRLYLETWVIPPLELILPGERRDPELARSLAN